MSGRVGFALAMAVIAVAVIVGLLLVGGPGQGQRDRFDAERYRELNELGRALLCERGAREVGRSLPQELSVDSLRIHCSGAGITADNLIDDETGEPYVYRRMSDRDFAICATFHDAGRVLLIGTAVSAGGPFDPDTGCVSGRIG